MQFSFSRIVQCLALVPFCGMLWGCHAAHTSITKRDLRVHTRMSQTIFIAPLPDNQKIVYLDTHFVGPNAVGFEHKLANRLRMKGYKVTHDMRLANYIVQSNTIRSGFFEHPGAEDRMLMRGFGGAVTGALIGSAITDDSSGAVVGGVIGSLVNMSVVERHYMMVSDIQISQRISGQMVYKWTDLKTRKAALRKHMRLHSDDSHVWERSRTRLLSTASRVNLHAAHARRALNQALVNTLASFF